jgi:1-acyl-sn-glycerol-3-phosphate acyltransferase
MKWWIYDFFRALAKLVLNLIAHIEIKGAENVPASGPFILASNHTCALDPPVAMAAIPRHVNVLAAHKWKYSMRGFFLIASRAIFVKRGEIDRQALQKCSEVLNQGGAIGIAPEGTRSHRPGMQGGRVGVAYLASHTGVPILPIGLIRVQDILNELVRFRRAHVLVNIGPAFHIPPIDLASAKSPSQQRKEASELIMYRIAELLPPEYRGVYKRGRSSEERDPSKDATSRSLQEAGASHG